MIRACLFDMGNVLVHFSHIRMLELPVTTTARAGGGSFRSSRSNAAIWDSNRVGSGNFRGSSARTRPIPKPALPAIHPRSPHQASLIRIIPAS